MGALAKSSYARANKNIERYLKRLTRKESGLLAILPDQIKSEAIEKSIEKSSERKRLFIPPKKDVVINLEDAAGKEAKGDIF